MLSSLLATAIIAIAATVAHAQSPALPSNYKPILENADIAVFRVHYGPHEKVGVHDHSKFPTVYVYLSDSGPVKFTHDETPALVITRPPAKAGSFRVAPGREERHSVENLGDQSSDFLRIEIKKLPLPDIDKPVRGPVPDTLAAGSQDEFTSSQLVIRRIVCDPSQPCKDGIKSPSLLVAISSLTASASSTKHAMQNGDVQWIAKPGPLSVQAASKSPAHLLQIELKAPAN